MTPRRNPLQLAANGIAPTVEQFDLPRIDLGVAALKADMRDHGWPARTPEDDQRPRSTDSESPEPGNVLDYADPTGELALAIERRHDDLNEIQDLQRTLTHTLKRLAALTGRYVPTATGDPVCSHNDCDDVVERESNGKGYRGMQLVAGIWCIRPGAKPKCARHRKAAERRERLEAEQRAEWEAKHGGAAA